MKKKRLLVISLALVLAVVSLSGCGFSSPDISSGSSGSTPAVNLSSQQQGIWVSGTGKVSVAPDIATLRLGIEAQETSVAVAQSEAAAAMDKVMAALTENGVAKKDIQTQYFNIRRVTKWDNNREEEVVIGYRVTNMVTAKIREMDRVGEIIDDIALAGGDLIRIDNIGFSVEDPSAYYEEVREKAVVDAKTKAEQLADFAGVKLGRATYISEGTVMPPVIYRQDFYAKAEVAPAMETPISPGELEISLNVQIAYAILD